MKILVAVCLSMSWTEREPAAILARALDDAKTIEIPFQNAVAHGYIAEAQSLIGETFAARRTLQQALDIENKHLRMASGDSKDDRIFTIAEFWAKIGDANEAAMVINEWSHPTRRNEGLSLVAHLFASRGDIHAALAVANQMHGSERDQTLALVKAVEPGVHDGSTVDDSPEGKFFGLLAAAKKCAAENKRDDARRILREAKAAADNLKDVPGISGVREAALAFWAGAKAACEDVAEALAWVDQQSDPWIRSMARVRIVQAMATQSPYRGKILLIGANAATNKEVGPSTVMAVRPDGTGLETLHCFEGAHVTHGKLSRDGRWLAVSVGSPADGSSIWLIGPDGKRRNLAKWAFIQAWSPDGKQLGVYREKDRRFDSVIIDVASGVERKLNLPSNDVLESWTPDGKRLVVMARNPERDINTPRGQYPKRSLYTTNLDGGDRRELTFEPQFDQLDGCFSPDGQRFAHFRRENPDVHKVKHFGVVRNADGSAPTANIAFDPLIGQWNRGFVGKPESSPCWSPDGKQVLWSVWRYPRSRSSGLEYYDLVFASPEAGIERRIELYKLGVVRVRSVQWR
jgi:hypothetical protein